MFLVKSKIIKTLQVDFIFSNLMKITIMYFQAKMASEI